MYLARCPGDMSGSDTGPRLMAARFPPVAPRPLAPAFSYPHKLILKFLSSLVISALVQFPTRFSIPATLNPSIVISCWRLQWTGHCIEYFIKHKHGKQIFIFLFYFDTEDIFPMEKNNGGQSGSLVHKSLFNLLCFQRKVLIACFLTKKKPST